MANQGGFAGSTQASPLLNSNRKVYSRDTSSFSASYEAKKSYGSTTKPVRSEVDTKIIGHVVQNLDTLQGLSIKYGVPVEDIKRVNKLWTNDNMHLYKIIKIPLRTESKFADLDDSDPECDMNSKTVEVAVENNKKQVATIPVNTPPSSSTTDSVESFLSKLDVTIKKDVQESEKLRCQSEKNVLGPLGHASNARQDDLFRPLTMSSSSHRRTGSGRIVNKGKSDILNADEHFFEL